MSDLARRGGWGPTWITLHCAPCVAGGAIRVAIDVANRGVPFRAMGSAGGASERGTVDADGVAAMAQPVEQGLDHGFLSEEAVPLLVVEVAGDDGAQAAGVALLDELEEEVGLLGTQVQVPEMVATRSRPRTRYTA